MYGLRDVAEYGIGSYGKPLILAWSKDAKFKVGKYCSIAGGVTVVLSAEHRIDWITTYPFPVKWHRPDIIGHPKTKGDVILENDVWIGWGATLLSGITINSGAVIGANAVVSRDVEPYSVVAGNPARQVKKRFSDETIQKLLKIKWWDWNVEKIKENLLLLCSDNIDEFINKHYTFKEK